ncbi:MAG: glycosyltransferase, partial [Maribacter stanieri]
MKLAIVTAYPPSKVTLTEYGYYLVKHFRLQEEVTELILITDRTDEPKDLNFEENGCKITVKECWSFNSYSNIFSISKTISQTKPDAVLFNLQFLKFGDKKIPAALGLMLPFICKSKGIPTISLLHNILEQVDLENAGFTKNKLLQSIYNLIGTTLTKFVLASDILAVTISKYVTTLEDKYKVKNVALIPHGAFETPPEPDFKLPAGPKQVMAFGKFGTYKKVEILIEAVEEIRARTNEDIEIVIAGTDSPNTPGYLEEMKQKYSHVPQIRYTGYVAEEDV